MVRPSTQSEALTPTNITAKRSTSYGSADVQAVKAGKSTLFIQRAKRKIRELIYTFQEDGFNALDLSILSEHITSGGIDEVSFMKESQPILWCVRNDGVLVGLTYERETDSFRVGWHRHIFGGVSDAADTDAKVESVAVIPTPDGKSEELWVSVQRYINGSTRRFVEYMVPFFYDDVEQKDAFFVDSGLTYDAPFTITGVTQADPGVVTTSSNHGFSNGDKVLISDVKGMTELNDVAFLVANVTATTFELQDLTSTDEDTTSNSAYVSGGEVRKYVSTISGLDHLEGETVSVLGDGAHQPDKVVSSGAITLQNDATTVHIGLSYNADGKLLRKDPQGNRGTTVGKNRRSHEIHFLLNRSLGLKIGTAFDDLTELTFRTSGDKLGRAPALFTGIFTQTLEGDSDTDDQLCWRSDSPLPLTILSIANETEYQE
jgi:hypothetical protein